jgi:hypothetical protein
MEKRSGEKVGWIGGWFGGFIWVIALSILFAFQGKQVESVFGFVLTLVSVFIVILTAPWKHPKVAYWKLMIPVYVVFFGSSGWALWAFGGIGALDLNWWNIFWVFPILIPIFTIGKRRWNDYGA